MPSSDIKCYMCTFTWTYIQLDAMYSVGGLVGQVTLNFCWWCREEGGEREKEGHFEWIRVQSLYIQGKNEGEGEREREREKEREREREKEGGGEGEREGAICSNILPTVLIIITTWQEEEGEGGGGGRRGEDIDKKVAQVRREKIFNILLGKQKLFSLPFCLSIAGRLLSGQRWTLSVFLNFFNNKKWFFAFFSKFIWLGVGFSNRTGAEIGYYLVKNAKKSFFIIEKTKKNTKSAQLWQLASLWRHTAPRGVSPPWRTPVGQSSSNGWKAARFLIGWQSRDWRPQSRDVCSNGGNFIKCKLTELGTFGIFYFFQ